MKPKVITVLMIMTSFFNSHTIWSAAAATPQPLFTNLEELIYEVNLIESTLDEIEPNPDESEEQFQKRLSKIVLACLERLRVLRDRLPQANLTLWAEGNAEINEVLENIKRLRNFKSAQYDKILKERDAARQAEKYKRLGVFPHMEGTI